jgi:glycosyltransferase involved in cell wall biosynthesis
MSDPHLKGGGQVRYVTNLAGELVRLGHRVTIGCKPDSVLVSSAQEARCDVRNAFAYRGGLRPLTWVHDIGEMRRLVQEDKPDIIHASGSQDHWVAGLSAYLQGHPVCLVRTRHNTYPVHDRLSNRILNRRWTDYQIVVCDVVRRELAQQRAFDGERMCSIHNGVDAELFAPDVGARHETRAEFGYTDQHIVCGIAARLVPAKGHEFLFRAVAMVKDELPNLRVLVLGQGDLEHQLKSMVGELGIEDRVNFAGFRDDVARYVQAFDVGVQPSIDCDTSSFSLKEQMASGKAVIASDYGGLTEIVSDGVEGYVVPNGVHEPLGEALRRLARDPNLRAAMGEAGRVRVQREFTVQIFAERTVEAYRRAIAIHRQR